MACKQVKPFVIRDSYQFMNDSDGGYIKAGPTLVQIRAGVCSWGAEGLAAFSKQGKKNTGEAVWKLRI